jgi:hypothetical protein
MAFAEKSGSASGKIALNVFSDEGAAARRSMLRANASTDLHNLVYRADDRIARAVTINCSRMTEKLKAMPPSTKRSCRESGID